MSTKASTAALTRSAEIIPPPATAHRATRLAVQKLQEGMDAERRIQRDAGGRRSTKTESPVIAICEIAGQHGSGIMAAVISSTSYSRVCQTKLSPPQSRGRFSSSSVLVLLLASIPLSGAPRFT